MAADVERVLQGLDAARSRRERQLRECRGTIESLESGLGLARSWRWPSPLPSDEVASAAGAQEQATTEMSPERRLAEHVAHLRATHRFCFWCGCTYASLEELRAGCPGPSEEDH